MIEAIVNIVIGVIVAVMLIGFLGILSFSFLRDVWEAYIDGEG
jgi:hypothetical protein